MKKILKLSGVAMLALVMMSFTPEKEKKEKKIQKFKVCRVLPFSADQVWAAVGTDYGKIADMHPRIMRSEYISGTLKAGTGAERICYFNESGSQYLKEQIVAYRPEQMELVNKVYQAGKFPIVPEVSRALYKVTPIDANSCELSFDFQYRTQPGFMGGMMKKKFMSLISDYFIAVQHHISTGEKVNKENFKEIKKEYKTAAK